MNLHMRGMATYIQEGLQVNNVTGILLLFTSLIYGGRGFHMGFMVPYYNYIHDCVDTITFVALLIETGVY